MPCGWEGNRRSGVTLATRQTVVLHLRAQGLEEGDEHPHALLWSMVDFTLPLRRMGFGSTGWFLGANNYNNNAIYIVQIRTQQVWAVNWSVSKQKGFQPRPKCFYRHVQ